MRKTKKKQLVLQKFSIATLTKLESIKGRSVGSGGSMGGNSELTCTGPKTKPDTDCT
ncbi:hypothetical protein [Kordia sp.]|uniref:hypothetical protein n=1 Tax=Kordia sp. TaxID=1965332 RepID=UPI003D6BFB4B